MPDIPCIKIKYAFFHMINFLIQVGRTGEEIINPLKTGGDNPFIAILNSPQKLFTLTVIHTSDMVSLVSSNNMCLYIYHNKILYQISN